MTTRYVGPGGNDGNSGLTWALRKLTLNGVEDTPVVAGDTVYIGPGVYRETLTIDVSGTAGNIITYVGDVTGEHTDGVGGSVRITGSDNDQTGVRASCIAANTRDYRTFRGIVMDTSTGCCVNLTNCDYGILEDCTVMLPTTSNCSVGIYSTSTNITIRRCLILPRGDSYGIWFSNGATIDNTGHLVENCIVPGGSVGIRIDRVGGITVRNSLFPTRNGFGIQVSTALADGQTTTVNNCIFQGNGTALGATVLGEITEDFNTLFGNSTARTNVGVGGNSVAYPALFVPPILHSGASQVSGFKFPWWFGELSEWSQVRAIAGTSMSADDLRGFTRPTTDSKKSWGAVQFCDAERSSAQAEAGTYSMVLADAARIQIIVPVTNVSTTISVEVYREADYTGTNPQLIIKQPGQADDVTTDAAAASQFNELTTTLTPVALPPYIIVELVSNNTAVAGSYNVYFDTLAVN